MIIENYLKQPILKSLLLLYLSLNFIETFTEIFNAYIVSHSKS